MAVNNRNEIIRNEPDKMWTRKFVNPERKIADSKNIRIRVDWVLVVSEHTSACDRAQIVNAILRL